MPELYGDYAITKSFSTGNGSHGQRIKVTISENAHDYKVGFVDENGNWYAAWYYYREEIIEMIQTLQIALGEDVEDSSAPALDVEAAKDGVSVEGVRFEF